MRASRGFPLITIADFIVRSAYQMGKTPLLPIYAAALGAGDILLGFIVSVSTLTGMVLKPFIGLLSDRWGRRAWLLVGTAFFAGMPFLYRFVDTPEQLFMARMAHGLATAIYGPVTLAYVAEISRERRAERLGWFSSARNAGYIVGPVAAGWMLLTMDPVSVFTVVGILSSLAFIPVLMLPGAVPAARSHGYSLLGQVARALRSGGRTPAVWLAGGLEAHTYVAAYAVKAFLPLYALHNGASTALVGVFFGVQVAVQIALSPIGGRVGDRLGHLPTAAAGMLAVGAALTLLGVADSSMALLAPALLIGAGQALVFPSTVALVSTGIDERHLGAGMGLVGALRNSGKVAGPAVAGVMVHWLGLTSTFALMGLMLLAGALAVLFAGHSRRASAKERTVPA